MPPVSPAAPAMHNRSTVPGPPVQPAPTSRLRPGPAARRRRCRPGRRRISRPADPLPAGEMKPCDGTRIIARVGSEAILESEVAGAVNEIHRSQQGSHSARASWKIIARP